MRIVIAAAALLAVAGCGDSETPSPSPSTEAAPIPTKVYAVGDTASAAGVEVTLTSVKSTSHVTNSDALPAAGPDETYIIAEYSLKNTGTKPIEMFDRPALELVDAAGQTYAMDTIASTVAAVLSESNGTISAINPGTSAKSALVWKVAKKSYDPATWKVVVRTDPALEFKLN